MSRGPQDLTVAERSLVGVALADALTTTRRMRDALARVHGASHPEVRGADVDMQTMVTALHKLAPALVPAVLP